MPPSPLTITINKTQQRKIDRLLKRAPATTHGVMRYYLEKVGDRLKREIFKEAPKGVTTILRTRTIAKVKFTQRTLRLDVYSLANYADVVYFGRKPGKMPPWRDPQFVRWVHRFVSDEPSAPFLVARSIGRHGTKPNMFYDRALKNSRSYINRELDRNITKLTRRLDAGRV